MRRWTAPGKRPWPGGRTPKGRGRESAFPAGTGAILPGYGLMFAKDNFREESPSPSARGKTPGEPPLPRPGGWATSVGEIVLPEKVG